MELRVLQYFLAIAREETISGAAQQLHITQPTLSRQMKELEDELGKQLFIRSNKKITLTEEGIILRQRAEEIINLVDKTELEIMSADSSLKGDIYIGAGESHTLKIITKSMKKIHAKYPEIQFHIHSGNAPDVIEKLDNGLIDFALLTSNPKINDYHHLLLPLTHQWGVLMLKDDPLAQKEAITFQDIQDKPLIVSKELQQISDLVEWLHNDIEHLNIISSYTLLYNASLMVEDGLGYAICFDKLINTTGDSLLCFRPLSPHIEVPYYFIWKKYQVLTRTSQYFLDVVSETIQEFIES
ncbi:LysR family transcriptional regulator [Clostridium sp. AUH-JLR23]|jgi:DNA-binding transcriptional LysR family regulator|uniref:LysR family transcriptional regulator n=1 Tax=Clostridium sp. AUH-JLR23 TaxID=1505062 RepID=UPI00356B250C